MTVTAIIAEYNPFHKGHAYQILEARKRTGADFILVLMSGYFTERGIPACFSPFTRAECAVLCGADLVLQLPVCYATGSAEIFAEGAVNLLSCLNCVDYLVFGSEEIVEASVFLEAASFLNEEPEAYKKTLKQNLKNGMTFPEARATAAAPFLSEAASKVLSAPNALLGVEYCRALLSKKSSIKPYPLLRSGSGYHDSSISHDNFSSATALRTLLAEKKNENSFFNEIPEANRELLSREPLLPVFPSDFNLMIQYAIHRFSFSSNRNESEDHMLSCISDVSGELAARILSASLPQSYESLVEYIKTRQYTRTRVERVLLHILLGITKKDIVLFKKEGTCYARPLLCGCKSRPLLQAMKRGSQVPILTTLSQYKSRCTEQEKKLLSFDLSASLLYREAVYQKYNVLLTSDFSYNVSKNLT